ncbi:MAG: SDR family NAD(P)-dependent oxidoreductase [Chloroflexi bacterium]|nr:SDR family NAD(P)-dependent oxidoreductase [Ardenticatenaceae bacterium]MBL1129432.1 SDR family NAD(P)-dependent oxidoreductase [Chloroflexota bacterium]NOG35512.1 SDR family NAD(P)-dependent oxidoreductase [Chloroflexota bacterium]GIK57461.1 MAG: hypothetical protein BroJett015_31240 [Chloroflexota bacterium]
MKENKRSPSWQDPKSFRSDFSKDQGWEPLGSERVDGTKTILITGATSGIGLSLAQQLAVQGVRLLLVGRRPLADLSEPIFTPDTYCQADLARPQAIAQITDFLDQQQIGALHGLVHNAAVGYYGDLNGQPAASIDDLLAINLLTPIRLTQALRPRLLAASGTVTFISTVATAVPTPEYAVYGASKAALEGFARSLRVEWQGQIGVQIIRPGATRTPMHEKSGIPVAKMDWRKFPPAEATAASIAAALSHPRPAITIGFSNQLLRFVGRNGRFLLDPIRQKQARRKERENGTTGEWGKLTHAPVALITGVADGIGKALAWQFARAGYGVVGIDVDEAKGIATTAELTRAGFATRFLHADLSCDGDLAWLVKELHAAAPLDVLIHNAGISAVGRFEQLDLAAQERVLAVNLRAPLHLTAALGRSGLFSAAPSLVFLSSLSHYTGYPGAAVYAASKDGVAHYGRSLSLAWPYAHTLTVFPGPTRTAHARRYSPDNSRETSRMPPEQVAAAIYQAVHRRRPRLIPGLGNQLIALGGHLLPTLLEWSMKKAILEKLDV